MDTNNAKEAIQRTVKEFMQTFVGPDGQLDVMNFLRTHFGGQKSAEETREQMAKLETLFSDSHETFTEVLPWFHAANKVEIYQLHRLSEMAIPYWFAIEKFNFNNDLPCSAEAPFMCLSPNAISVLFAWQQITTFAVGVFMTILFGGVTAALFSGRKLRKGALPKHLIVIALCFLLDIIGILSLLIPVAGNVIDVIWAPIAGMISTALLRSSRAGFLVFAKELLPLGDIVPLATLMAISRLFE